MMKILNRKGFKEAMKEGKTWTTLDCQISQTEPDRWYWEIEKHQFDAGSDDERNDTCEQLGHGEDGDDLANVKKIWSNLIEKYSPDEYFVDQHCFEPEDLEVPRD